MSRNARSGIIYAFEPYTAFVRPQSVGEGTDTLHFMPSPPLGPVAPPPSGSLLRILGLSFGIAAALGGTIGVGILRAPGIVATHLPDPAWIVGIWVAGGVYALLGTLCVIELSTSMPKAGGWYVYTREAFGDFPAFVVGWSFWLALSASLGYISIAFSEYLVVFVPGLSAWGRNAGLAVLVGFTAFQFLGLRPVSWFTEFTGILKGVVFLGLVAACFLFAPDQPPVAAMTPAVAVAWLPGLVLAAQAVVKTYDGWYSPFFFTEEDRNPTRNVPRAMLIGTGTVIVIFVGLNAAMLSILTVPEIAGSKLPAADAFARIFGGATGRVLTGLAILSIAGLLNTIFMSAPRILFAMARDGLFFSRASHVTAGGVPSFATLFSGGAALVLVFGGNFERVFAMSAFMSVVCYTVGYSALFVLRRKHPDWPRPFKVWGYPWVPAAALLGSVAFLAGSIKEDTASAGWSLVALAASYPVFLVLRRAQRRAPVLR